MAVCSLLTANAHAGVQAGLLPDLLPADRINLEEFEPAVRDQISRAYEEARSKPQDGAAVGRLGMMFQVYGRYELAETCYIRACGLDPRSFAGCITWASSKNRSEKTNRPSRISVMP
jgi:Flp pilus assembly protein TadD